MKHIFDPLQTHSTPQGANSLCIPHARLLWTLILLIFTGGVSGRTAYADETVWLGSLDLSSVNQGFGKPHMDKSVDGNPITLAGRRFEHGLGTHSPGDFLIDLDGGSTRFTATVGIDDETKGRGSVVFQIVGDGKLLWSSGLIKGGQAPKTVDLNVSGIRRLALLIDDGGDGYEYDHADWADAAFTVTGARPHPGKLEISNPTVADPETSTKPKITSPVAFGVRPGTPVLYTITALSNSPVTYTAANLPRGLKLDRATGQITGSLTQSGKYAITLSAANDAGKDTRKLNLSVGDTISLTPPLGWNSYDAYGDDVIEAEILANARYIKANLQAHGWDYVVVDYRWYDPGASTAPNNTGARAGAALTADAFGRLEPAANRFPSSEGGKGFKPLAETIHAMGLKFGIHVMRGIPRQAVKANTPIEGSAFHAADAANTASTCPWCPDMYGVDASKPAGQAWYDSILRQYALWGVDYIKVDDLSAPYSAGEIEAIHRAIEKCGRSIILSLSPGDTPVDRAEHVEKQANLWRISGDFWDDWGAVSRQFDLISRWQGHGGPGYWPDADMIPLGHLSVAGRSVGPDRRTNLTKDEQLTMMSLWAMAPSPLMLGMNLPDNDPWTLALITNDEVLAVNQDPLGKQALRLPASEQSGGALLSGTEVWVKELADGSHVIGLFNRIKIAMPVSVKWSTLGLKGPLKVRDLWQRKDLGTEAEGFQTTVGPHSAVLIQIR